MSCQHRVAACLRPSVSLSRALFCRVQRHCLLFATAADRPPSLTPSPPSARSWTTASAATSAARAYSRPALDSFLDCAESNRLPAYAASCIHPLRRVESLWGAAAAAFTIPRVAASRPRRGLSLPRDPSPTGPLTCVPSVPITDCFCLPSPHTHMQYVGSPQWSPLA